MSAANDLGSPVSLWFHNAYPTTYREYAALANFKVSLMERFDIQFGERQNENRQTFAATMTGSSIPIVPDRPDPLVNGQVTPRDDSFTHLVTRRLRISSDLMVYARLASGYHTGGPNYYSVLGVPGAFGPDRTEYDEIGVKRSLAQHALSFDASRTSLFVRNATDERGVLSGGLGSSYDCAFHYIQPRAVGLLVSKTCHGR